MINKLPVIDIYGAPREKGLAHGEMFRNEINEIIAGFSETVLLHSEGRKQTITLGWWREWAIQSVPYITDYFPEFVEEVKGISESANVALEDILCLNAFLDIWDWITPHIFIGRYGRAQGCTAFGVSGLIGSGKTIVGQNYDLEALFQKGAVFFRVHDCDGKESLIFTISGILGCAGMNNQGLAVVINNLTASDARAGVPYPYILRRSLLSSNIGEAIDSIVGARRTSGMNYILASKCGAVISIETSATDFAVIHSIDKPIFHANHFLHNRLAQYEARSIVDRGHSIYRQYRMEYLFNELKTLGKEELVNLLSDHENYPIGICRHDEPADTCGKTIASMIFLPSQQTAYFTSGNPCESEFMEFQF
jgi:isopenicillin-N N-acyltransferase like protein